MLRTIELNVVTPGSVRKVCRDKFLLKQIKGLRVSGRQLFQFGKNETS